MRAVTFLVSLSLLCVACESKDKPPTEEINQAPLKIDASCIMEPSGKGKCSFTNLDSTAGSVCGRAFVRRTTTPIDPQKKVIGVIVREKRRLPRSEVEQLATQIATQKVVGEVKSSLFCSGSVSPKETKAVEFFVDDVSTLCSGMKTEDWGINCALGFRGEEPAPNSATPVSDDSAKLKEEVVATIDAIDKIHAASDQVQLVAGLVESYHRRTGSYPSDLKLVNPITTKDLTDPWGMEISIRVNGSVAFICSPGLDKERNHQVKGGMDICEILPRY